MNKAPENQRPALGNVLSHVGLLASKTEARNQLSG